MAIADSKLLVVEHSLAEVEDVRDEALAKVASLEFKCRCLAQPISNNADEMLG